MFYSIKYRANKKKPHKYLLFASTKPKQSITTIKRKRTARPITKNARKKKLKKYTKPD